MVLSSVDLPHGPANTRPIIPHYNEKVLGNKPDALKGEHDLDVREALLVRAHFILALHYEDSALAQYAVGFLAGVPVQVQRRFMVLAGGLPS